jgi:hypothetical protein
MDNLYCGQNSKGPSDFSKVLLESQKNVTSRKDYGQLIHFHIIQKWFPKDKNLK